MKKGFTIAELMGVVIILAIIMLISFPFFLNMMKETNNEIDTKTEEIVIVAAKDYVTRNNNEFQKIVGSTYKIEIKELVNNNLITNTLVEKTNLKLESCVKVKVNSEYKYEYELNIDCGE